jgi:2-oxoglutarate ferredoxin oxidoreductase subunit beta
MSAPAPLTKRDFQTDQDVRWCPGCGDYAILSTVQKVFPTLGIARENFAIISGIGCASRFPYYMNTYGFHSIHGRAPAIATGTKLANPDLSVWVVSGDGDALSIGGNHLIHALRRNIDIKILLFNNRIYGLTKGQTSPTSELGKRTKSTPQGSIDRPVNPISLALGAGATFVARSVDVQADHMAEVIERAAAHKGTALVEILQNCNIFNNGAFAHITERDVRADRQLVLEHGKPLRFGKDGEKGIRLNRSTLAPEIVTLGDGVDESDLLVHNEGDASTYQHLLAELGEDPFPVPIGVFRAVELPSYEVEADAQVTRARANGVRPSDAEL